MANNVYIQCGDTVLDTDEQTKLGFAYQSRWLFSEDGGRSRTFDLSVPETETNNKVFDFHEEPVMSGVRQSMSAVVISDGVNINGKLFVTQWSGGRYSLLFVFGKGGDGFGDILNWIIPNTLSVDEKANPRESGSIDNFGWYSYHNGTTTGTVGDPVTMYPAANLGYIISTMASYLGYTVQYPAAILGRQYQADAYGLILDRMDYYTEDEIGLSGSPAGGWTVTVQSGNPLSSVGLSIVQKPYRRGVFNLKKYVSAFVATKPVKIKFAGGQSVIVASGEGYDLRNGWNGQAGCEFELQTGDWFTVVSDTDWGVHSGSSKWNGGAAANPGYEGAVSASFSVYLNGDIPSDGNIINLAENLPDMSLKDYLNAYCNLICALWEVDETTNKIIIRPLDAAIGHLSQWLDLDNERIVSIGAVRRYIDGWSRRNLVRCKTADGVPEWSRFIRDYPVSNDYLDEERQIAEIPFNEGEWMIGGGGRKELFCDNVTTNANGEVAYRGVLTVFFENQYVVGGALHVQTVNDLGVGSAYGDFTRNANTVEVSVLLSLRRFMELDDSKAVTLRGATYVVESAQWGDGVAKLKLLSVNT